MQDEQPIRSESAIDPEPLPADLTPGVKVYDRPTGLRALPAWVFVLLALLIVAGLWAFFSYAL